MSSFLGRLLLALQTLQLSSPLGSLLALPPRQPTVTTVMWHSSDTSPLGSPTNLPVSLTVHVARAQLGARRSLDSLDIRHTNTVLINRSNEIRLSLDAFGHRHRGHVQLTPAGRIARVRKLLILVENNSDIPALRVLQRVEVVAHVASLCCIDCVVPSHPAVLTGEP
jgi:hypothetical protein